MGATDAKGVTMENSLQKHTTVGGSVYLPTLGFGCAPIGNLYEPVSEEQAQDTVEYTLLLAFVVLASAALFITGGGTIQTIWAASGNLLSTAQSAAS